MVTIEQILAAEGEELSRLLGEVFHPEKICGFCEKWDIKLYDCEDWPEKADCTEDRPACEEFKHGYLLPLNWDNAMKWRDWAVKEYGESFFNAMTEVMIYEKPHWGGFKTVFEAKAKFMGYLVGWGKPKHYLQAAAIAKLNAEKGK